jgi:protein TBF1
MGEDHIAKATLAAHAAISAHAHAQQQQAHAAHHAHHLSISLNSLAGAGASATSAPFHPGPMLSFADSPTSLASGRSFRSGTGSTGSPTSPGGGGHHPHHPQSIVPLPYARATSHPSAAAARPTSGTSGGGRRPNAPSPRRPWTQDEEKALLDGLERVKGPHWSQILALYGAGGSVSEVLKDRNQVQLKDKARNLKLFFLKSGVEVPGYLKRVTGELRTRAPGQAARRERERRREEEERLRRERDAVGV